MIRPGPLVVGLVHEVFAGIDAAGTLAARLRETAEAGAALALPPELPLDRWIPATRDERGVRRNRARLYARAWGDLTGD